MQMQLSTETEVEYRPSVRTVIEAHLELGTAPEDIVLVVLQEFPRMPIYRAERQVLWYLAQRQNQLLQH